MKLNERVHVKVLCHCTFFFSKPLLPCCTYLGLFIFKLQGEATSVFDETSISLPGSLEERNRHFELPQDDEMFPSIGMETLTLFIPRSRIE